MSMFDTREISYALMDVVLAYVVIGTVSLTFRELYKTISQKYALQEITIIGKNLNLELCKCAQSHALGTHTKFKIEILIRNTISAIHKFRVNILESSRNVSETPPTSWKNTARDNNNEILILLTYAAYRRKVLLATCLTERNQYPFRMFPGSKLDQNNCYCLRVHEFHTTLRPQTE